jgi:alcohol dehydrogenase class IV
MFLRMGIKPGGSHGIGHQLGPYGVPHGETTCIILPSVLKYNMSVNAAKQQALMDVLWQSETVAGVLKKYGVKEDGTLSDGLDAIIRELGLPRTLKEAGIGRDKWEHIAENSLNDFLTLANPRQLTTKEQVMEILEMSA